MAKVMVSLPDDLLREVDRRARLLGTSRSGLLADAARKELSRQDPEARRAAVERMAKRATTYGAPTLADLTAAKQERDERDTTR